MMEKYMNRLLIALLGMATMSSCKDDEGTEPGNDSNPNIVLYQYAVESPNDPDNDSAIRIAVNNKTSEIYYLAELTANVSGHGATDEAYADYVVSNGTKVTTTADVNNGGNYADVVVTGMKGEYTISAVAVSGNKKAIAKKTFVGLEWIDVANGTYNFSDRAQRRLGVGKSVATTLQYLKTNETKYRFKNIYGAGHSLILIKTDKTGTDDNDALLFYRVENQTTPFSYSTYGTVSVRDLGYWQDDDSFAYDPKYGCFEYTDKLKRHFTITIQYHVSAGNLGYGTDKFVPD